MQLRVTANQITFARLVAMPILAALLYMGHAARWTAWSIGAVVAMTDFVDGWLARRQGPTVLGGLMDPVADKVFLACAFLPYADRGWAPWGAVAAIFLREFVVTALRSSFELRERVLRTTYLAKVKAWVQMAGIGVMLLVTLQPPRWVVGGVLFAGAGLALVAGVIVIGLLKRKWRGVYIFFVAFSIHAAIWAWRGGHAVSMSLLSIMVAVTWLSGVDYVAVAARELVRRRDLHAFDVVRLAGAIALPLLAVLDLIRTPSPAWPIIGLVSLELAHGGLDNLLAHHKAADPAWAWGGRVLAAAGCLGAALAMPAHAAPFAIAAFTISLVGTAVSFTRNRRFYLEEKLREKKRAAASTPVVGSVG